MARRAERRAAGGLVTGRRQALSALGGALALGAQADARTWIPARRKHGAPVTHVVAGRAVPAGVRLLESVRWPGLQVPRDDGTFAAGPSGPPWINTNAWLIQRERTLAPGSAVWVSTGAAVGRTRTAEECVVALCDCEASGARWVIDCEDAHFPRVAEALRFFDAHAAWRDFEPPVHLGLVTSARPEMREVMNLMSRFAVPYRLVTAPVPGMAVLVVFGPPDGAANSFARAGGLVISLGWNPDKAGAAKWVDVAMGAGQVAVWTGPPANAARFVKDLRARLGEDHDVLRAFNVHASTVRYTVRGEDQRGLVQLVNFTGRPTEDETTIWVRQLATRALLHDWSGPARPLSITSTGGGTEVSIPARGAYAAVELFPPLLA